MRFEFANFDFHFVLLNRICYPSMQCSASKLVPCLILTPGTIARHLWCASCPWGRFQILLVSRF